MAKVIVYFFHKNIVITAVIFFYTTNCAYSGQVCNIVNPKSGVTSE